MIEAVLARPKMYTLSGEYGEVVAFLHGFYSGIAKRVQTPEELLVWQDFSEWLTGKLQASSRPTLYVLHDKYGKESLNTLNAFYQEFKIEKQ